MNLHPVFRGEPCVSSILKIKVLVFSITLLTSFSDTFSQIKKIGVPFITNYTPQIYGAASENWDVTQDSIGTMYFGNHFGLMKFDGVRWQIVAQPDNKSMVRSIAIDKNGRIYIGAQGEFGYLTLLPNGGYKYTSLVHLIPKAHQNFGDVWRTVIRKNEVVFQSKSALYILKNDAIKMVLPKGSFEDFMYVNDQIYVFDPSDGLLKIENNKPVSILSLEMLHGLKVKMVYPQKKGLLILTLKEGLFSLNQNKLVKWPTEADYLLKNGIQVSCGMLLSNEYFAIGTRQNGLILIDNNGHLIQHINKQNGLQCDYVTNMKTDFQGNLWLTLKDGIDFLEISSPISRIKAGNNQESKIYSSYLYKQKLYVGTDNGLFWLDWEAYSRGNHEKIAYKNVKGIHENVWNLGKYNDKLLAFESNGIYQIEDVYAKLIAKTEGAWAGVNIPQHPDLLIAGGYTGLYLLKYINHEWIFQYKIKGIQENCASLSSDKSGNLWIAHGYKGIYQITLNPSIDSVINIHFYDQNKGFPSSLFLNTFKIDDQVVFGTTKGVYKKSTKEDKMIPDESFSKFLGNNEHIRLLEADQKNNIWFISGDNTGVIHKFIDGSFHVEELAFKKLKNTHIPGFENIQTTESGDVFFGTQNGLTHYSNSTSKNYTLNFTAGISEVIITSPKDSLIFSSRFDVFKNGENPFLGQNDFPVLPYINNSIQFTFSALWYENTENTQFQYWLEGFESNWSSWVFQTEKEYTNLPEGTYTFHLKAKNLYETIGRETTYKFKILPPWYRTLWALGAYLIILGLIIYTIVKYQRHQASLADQ